MTGISVVRGQRPEVIARDDEDDRLWLEERLFSYQVGLMAAQRAAIDIAKNWNSGRCVARLFAKYPDAADFLLDKMGPIRLPQAHRQEFLVALIESGASRRKAAKAAGVGHSTADRAASAPFGAPKLDPTNAERLAKEVSGVLVRKRTRLPGDFELWLAAGPSSDERNQVAEAFESLATRAHRWAERAKSDG